LDRVFKDAEESGTVLFFDEADAIFGKRSEVTDARDRYSNIDIDYLTRRLEDCDSRAILTTNLSLELRMGGRFGRHS
jgi:SpoVK/Ycf46/Vps4 family AAA+-type ATPase